MSTAPTPRPPRPPHRVLSAYRTSARSRSPAGTTLRRRLAAVSMPAPRVFPGMSCVLQKLPLVQQQQTVPAVSRGASTALVPCRPTLSGVSPQVRTPSASTPCQDPSPLAQRCLSANRGQRVPRWLPPLPTPQQGIRRSVSRLQYWPILLALR